MESLDQLYADMLHRGFLVLQQALDANDVAWARAEVELLHNIPGLIGEQNLQRHRYFWLQERMHYLAWIESSGHSLAKSRMTVYYAPVWQEMEPLYNELLSTASPQV